MKVARRARFGAWAILATTLSATCLIGSPPSTAAPGQVEVNFCVVDQTGQTQANVPVQLQALGTDGNWHLQGQGDSGSGCTSFYKAPAPATYRVTTASNTGACQGATQAVNAVPGPQMNVGNLSLSCVIGGPA